jgi:hypothetical protein
VKEDADEETEGNVSHPFSLLIVVGGENQTFDGI